MGVLLAANDRSLCHALARPLLTVPAKMCRSHRPGAFASSSTNDARGCRHRQESSLLWAPYIGPLRQELA